jgi:hypothetical protein
VRTRILLHRFRPGSTGWRLVESPEAVRARLVEKVARAIDPKAWGFMLFSALVDIALGVIIFAGLPGSAIWVLGLLVGINLLFTGVALITVDVPAIT